MKTPFDLAIEYADYIKSKQMEQIRPCNIVDVRIAYLAGFDTAAAFHISCESTVRADEREKCAKLAEDAIIYGDCGSNYSHTNQYTKYMLGLVADIIRSRTR